MTGYSIEDEKRGILIPVNHARIQWAPKLRPDKLVRLYRSDAVGVLDDELLDDVAWTRYCRVRDVVRVSS